MTVDDCLLAGKPADMIWLMDEVSKYLKITCKMEVKKHLGIDYNWKQDNDGGYAHQIHHGEKGK